MVLMRHVNDVLSNLPWYKINDEHLLLSMRDGREMGGVLTSDSAMRINIISHGHIRVNTATDLHCTSIFPVIKCENWCELHHSRFCGTSSLPSPGAVQSSAHT